MSETCTWWLGAIFTTAPAAARCGGSEFYMQLQKNGPLIGTEEGSAGDLFANLRVLKKKKKKRAADKQLAGSA